MLYILFAITLLGIAIFNKKSFIIALSGFILILSYKLITDADFNVFRHFFGSVDIVKQIINQHLRDGEWPILLNLFGLLLGFEILSKLFQQSGIPDILPNYLPDDWKGPFVLLIFIFIMSAFLDNIAAALIGGAIAAVVFNRRVHIGFIVAIVAAANAGGAGSVIGDTTTTMMWLNGVNPLNVLHAYIAAVAAFLVFGVTASLQQDKYQKIEKNASKTAKIVPAKLLVVILMLSGAILTNIFFDLPFVGVWLALLLGAIFSKIPWKEAGKALKGSLFLIFLVSAASILAVKSLPDPTVLSVFSLGIISAVFDNIPLTKLCLQQGGYDWGMLAYAVGFGGSIMWFGSSAGVAITNDFPEARNAGLWLRKGWYIIPAYILGFLALYYILGWNPIK